MIRIENETKKYNLSSPACSISEGGLKGLLSSIASHPYCEYEEILKFNSDSLPFAKILSRVG